MRFIIYGAGAIGGVIGSRLFQAGHDTVLIARGQHLRVMRERGLSLLTPTGAITQAIPAVAHPGEIRFRPDDVVLLTMKTQDTQAALGDLAAASKGIDLPIVCAQNGVENERLASRRFAQVYAMMVWLPATFIEPGEVLCHSTPGDGILDLGRFPHGSDPLAGSIAQALEASNFSARAVPDIMRWKYAKLLNNILTTVNALCGSGAEQSVFAAGVKAEALACYRAAGIPFASPDEEAQRHKDARVSIGQIKDHPRPGSSVWQSLARQTGAVETDFIGGEIVLLGALHGVDVRHNRAAIVCADRMAREHLAPGSFSITDLQRMAAAHSSTGSGS